MHPISEEYTVVRTDIVPLLLEMLQVNRHRELPQRLFATGDVLADLRTTQSLAFVSTHAAADFSEAYAHADAVLRESESRTAQKYLTMPPSSREGGRIS